MPSNPLLTNGRLNIVQGCQTYEESLWIPDLPAEGKVKVANLPEEKSKDPKDLTKEEKNEIATGLCYTKPANPGRVNHANGIGDKHSLVPPKREWGGDWKPFVVVPLPTETTETIGVGIAGDPVRKYTPTIPKKKKRTATAFRCAECRGSFMMPVSCPCPKGWVCRFCAL